MKIPIGKLRDDLRFELWDLAENARNDPVAFYGMIVMAILYGLLGIVALFAVYVWFKYFIIGGIIIGGFEWLRRYLGRKFE